MQAPSVRPTAAPQKTAECSFVSATGRHFDCLLAVSTDNRRAQEQLPLAKVSQKQQRTDKKKRERKRGSKERESDKRQTAGKMCVFSFHYTGSLKKMGEEKNVLVTMGVSGGVWRRVSAIRRHSADKYGTPQNRALRALKQCLMNRQQDERILLINKMNPQGDAEDRCEMRQAGDRLCYMLTTCSGACHSDGPQGSAGVWTHCIYQPTTPRNVTLFWL